MNEKPSYTNRLISQKSPYLLQHAHNPVDWYPWGQEAFDAAKMSDKPILLSVGYATCHWCHVMEKESFENPEVAKLLNETFINIKVDREELPEIDSLYMEFAQGMMSGAAGWPLNVILTPDLQPFFAATYLPPFSRHGLMGLTDLAGRIHEVWSSEEREQVVMQAAQVVQVFASTVHAQGEEIPEKELLQDVEDLLLKMADPVHGGMKGVPKFPIFYHYNFFLHYGVRRGESRAIFFLERSLDKMRRGGIFDQLGGGFSRYSVDEEWLIPHFEKMLYDNALAAHAYLEAWKFTGKNFYKATTEAILDYILTEMRSQDGGFYSAEDADSEGHEGLFYTWKPDEVFQVLGQKNGELFCEFFDVTPQGNFEGRNILHMPLTNEEFAAQKSLQSDQWEKNLLQMKKEMLKARSHRVHPLKDDKVLTGWNGLMIFSMIEAGRALQNEKYVDAALQAAQFIKSHLWEEGHLLRRWRDGEASYRAGLEEYAFLIRGVLSLFEAGFGTQWLGWAIQMAEILMNEYKAEGGAFYQTDGTDQNIILRKCHFSDGAEPSGNAIHCENLLRLYQITSEETYIEQAEDVLKGAKKYLDNYAPGYCYHMLNLDRYYDIKATTYVIALNNEEEYKKELMALLYREFIPNKSVIWRRENDEALMRLIPFLEEQKPVNGRTTLYPCKKGICQAPITDFREMKEIIESDKVK